MKTVGAFEAKTHFSALLQEVEQGERVVITKHMRPIAKLIPIAAVEPTKVKEAIRLLKAFAQKHVLGDIDWKTLRDEGRK